VREVNQVYCCSYQELLGEMPDKSIDLLCIDPPFGLNIGKMGYINNPGGVAPRKKYHKQNLTWDESTLNAEDIKELFRVSKNQVIFGANYFAHLLPPSKCWYVWDKRTADKFTCDFADCELIWTSFKKPARVIRWLWHGMIQQDMKHKEKRFHPTQKPVPVMRRLIEDFSKPGELILDCFCGSGSGLLAAQETGRRFIGCDKDQSYVDVARERLASAAPSLALAA
jgi:site-specific DNA-methyltransferase (adenine-specific)